MRALRKTAALLLAALASAAALCCAPPRERFEEKPRPAVKLSDCSDISLSAAAFDAEAETLAAKLPKYIRGADSVLELVEFSVGGAKYALAKYSSQDGGRWLLYGFESGTVNEFSAGASLLSHDSLYSFSFLCGGDGVKFPYVQTYRLTSDGYRMSEEPGTAAAGTRVELRGDATALPASLDYICAGPTGVELVFTSREFRESFHPRIEFSGSASSIKIALGNCLLNTGVRDFEIPPAGPVAGVRVTDAGVNPVIELELRPGNTRFGFEVRRGEPQGGFESGVCRVRCVQEADGVE